MENPPFALFDLQAVQEKEEGTGSKTAAACLTAPRRPERREKAPWEENLPMELFVFHLIV
jgi:hypothetical protein